MKYERSKARLGAVEVLYRYDIVNDDPEKVLVEVIDRIGLSGDAKQYIERLVRSTIEHLKDIDENLSSILKGWTIDRLSYIDRAILRLALCEMLYFEDIPLKVSINEAIELAKYFGTAGSAKFVNGVLDTFLKEKIGTG